jgi:hypothetical protein
VRRFTVSVSLAGCEHDRDPRGPWRRPVVPPRSATCTIELRWDEAGLAYPAVLDPTWTITTSVMTEPRSYHAATRLPDGTVLVVGGGANDASSADLYDPTSRTFAATGAMLDARSDFQATTLTNGQVLITGGAGSASELYEAGTFTAGPPAPFDSSYGTATELEDGTVLVVGGYDDGQGTARFEPSPTGGGAWLPTAPCLGQHHEHAASRLLDGRVLVTGGTEAGSLTAEIYDPDTNSWAAQPNMASRHGGHSSTALPDGRVLIAGGIDQN